VLPRARAQIFTNLHAFASNGGGNPWGALVLGQNTLYGTTSTEGGLQGGTIYAINTDGSGYTNLHDFTTGDDGANPYDGLIISGNTLYGTASLGGTLGYGNVYSVNTDGSNFKTIYSFGGTDGSTPWGGLVLSGNTLYGTTKAGGTPGLGTVFKVNTDGSGFATLHTFAGGNDGANPIARLILSGSTLYGSTQQGGSSLNGTLFSISINGTGFTNFYSFTTTTGPALVNNDGANPWAPLFLSGNTLYGTTYSGGMFGFGTVFSVNTDGTGFTTIHSFSAPSGANQANQDGGNPIAGVILSGETVYGAGQVGGSGGGGTVFSVSTNGTSFFPLYNFAPISAFNTPNADGAYPVAGLVLSGTTLYGTANTGGPSGYGSVFSVPVPTGPPELGISRSGANVIITWSTNITGFTLQSATNLDSPSFWSTVSPLPTVVNGQYTVTNPIAGTQQFYRLSQ
jgi:uncharacterized repeat protein (TIGR03803 family)